MPTLLMPQRYSADSVALWQAAVAAGWAVRRLAYGQPSAVDASARLAVYGEPVFALAIANALGRSLLAPPADWLTQLPAACLQRSVRPASVSALRAIASELPRFIKPAADKLFPARVYVSADDLPDVRQLKAATPIIIAEPVTWQDEYRCFVYHKQVLTASIYARQGEVAQTAGGAWPCDPADLEKAVAFAHSVLAVPGVQAPPGFVLDVGRIEGRGWAVVEANPAWGAGLYGCDAHRVLSILSTTCRPLADLGQTERRWIAE